jgi:hypothetical protein
MAAQGSTRIHRKTRKKNGDRLKWGWQSAEMKPTREISGNECKNEKQLKKEGGTLKIPGGDGARRQSFPQDPSTSYGKKNVI